MQQNNFTPLCNQVVEEDDLFIPEEFGDIHIELYSNENSKFGFKIYSKELITLSKLVPILNDFGFIVESEVRFQIEEIYLYKIDIDPKEKELIKEHQENIFSILKETIRENIKRGRLFELVLKENFCINGITLMRSFVAYLSELSEEYSQKELVTSLIKYPSICRKFLDLFLTKFDPWIDDRNKRMKLLQKEIEKSIKEIKHMEDDRIIKLFFELINNITRTNFFKKKDTLSHKISLVELKKYLKGIQPDIEIFVYSPNLRGVHLRMSKVSRGGIRWSKRTRGFRKEIRSLMATQEAKNAIIVPKGAKGGFVIDKPEEITKESFTNYYKKYIDALLDLVDNQNSKGIFHPKGMICYDGYDSYFVVAADRGTSNMSSVANDIAKSRGFWLEDAFASGSNTGYHHKKLGITAKGAITSIQRHFIEKGIDFYKEPITVVGVGSMSGDVFGNGLIQTKYFKLIAAISHNEIFIDPNPNIDIAFEERKRLFQAGGKWRDYDANKISKGGGVFKRDDPSIQLSKEIKSLLHSDLEYMSGEDLAKELLQQKVDLIYFGGIGTYVKSSQEDNLSIGDKENEYVRVDANKLNAYAICEGANLALTMKARIEYSLNGGHINLDSIDNSAGVDTSDHEVNYKILLHQAVENNKITHLQKIELLLKESDFVVKKVLKDSFEQSLAISNERKRSKEYLKSYKKTIRILESKMDIFKRSIFHIPKDRDFFEIVDDEGMIVRPILATILLYSKIYLGDLFLNMELIDESSLDQFLFDYFPQSYIDNFRDEILLHPLGNEIIATQMANYLINNFGIKLINELDSLEEEDYLKLIKQYLSLKKEDK